MSRSQFSFYHSFRIRYSEVDAQGIVFNAHYLTYFDTAITEYFRNLPYDYRGQVERTGEDYHTVKTLVEYYAPISFDDEIDVAYLEKNNTIKEFNIKPQVDRFEFSDGHSIILLSRGRLVNLGNATGHSSYVMSTSFTNQVLAQIAIWEQKVDSGVHVLSPELDEEVARLHLEHLGVKLTEMTDEQSKYTGISKIGPFKPKGYRY